MRIGLVGIPGSGKSKIAIRIWNTLNQEYEIDTAIIDNYVDPLVDSLGVDIGPNSKYLSNLMVAMEREKKEVLWCNAESDYIVCGTSIDSACYSMAIAAKLAPLGMQSEMMQQMVQKEMTGVAVLVTMTMDLVSRYDKIFYLPPPKSASLIVPGADSREIAPELLAVDNQMKAFFDQTGYPHVVLDGTLDQNAEKVIECLQLSASGVSSSDSTS